MSNRVFGCFAALLLGGFLLLADKPKATNNHGDREPVRLDGPARRQVPSSFYEIPQHFEPVEGMSAASQAFVSRGPGYSVLLDGTGAHFALRQAPQPPGKPGLRRPANGNSNCSHADMFLEGARPVAGEAMERLEGISNYLLGNNASAWRTNVPHFAKVRFRDIYAGVDLVYYGNQRQLEYDFVVKPGGNPESIRLSWGGVQDLRIESNGDLLLTIGGNVLRQLRPRVYQEIAGRRVEIAGAYRISAKKEVTFALGRFDNTRNLVIDPVMAYASYIGGAGADESSAIAVDDLGNTYISGRTSSADFRRQVSSPALQTSIRVRANQSEGSQYDAFVVKINPSGTGIVYSTYLGGTDHDSAYGIAVDGSRNVYVVGETKSAGAGAFPTAGAGARTSSTGDVDGFLTKLDATGANLIYSTYLGTPNRDVAYSIVLSNGNAFVTGQWNYSGTGDSFVARYGTATSATQEALRTAGGIGDDYGSDIAADALGNLYVTGTTGSPGLQTGASSLRGDYDGFLARLSPALSLTSFTYFGGIAYDAGIGIAVSPAGEAYITGETFSSGLGDSLYGKDGVGGDAYVARFNPSGVQTGFGYFGGSNSDKGRSIAIDNRGTAYVAGISESSDFPVSPFAQQRNNNGEGDAFVIRVAPLTVSSGWSLLFSTYFGGAAAEFAADLALSTSGVYVTGTATAGPGNTSLFPTSSTRQILSPVYGGGFTDSFVARLANAPVSFTTSTTYGPPASGRAPLARDASNFRILRSTIATNPGTVIASSCGANAANAGTGVSGISGCPNCQSVLPGATTTIVTATPGSGQTCNDQPAKIGCETNNEERTNNDGVFRCPSVNLLACTPAFVGGPVQLDSAAQDRDVTLEIPSECSWNIAAEQNSFIQVLSPVTASDETLARGRGTVKIRVSQNSTGQSRTGRVVANSVGLGELLIQQSAGISQSVSVSLTPAQATLTAGQSVVVTAAVTGAANTETNFSLSPADGALSCVSNRCTYSAPTVIAFTRSVTVTARSVQDPARVASAIIVIQSLAPAAGLRFVSLEPCRLMETRAEYNFQGRTGSFGPPFMRAGETRTLAVANSNVCQVPANAKAYVLNATLVPRGGVDFVTIWPGSETRPDFWSIRSPDGQTVANSAIVKSGNGSIQIYTSHDTDILLDISGYMTDDVSVSNLAYYPLTPCRVIDTRIEYRQPPGPFGPPSLNARETRRFRIPSTPYCAIPAGAAAYSVTITAVPQGPLQFLAAWADGRPQPNVSNINSPNGRVLANSVIIPASGDGTIDVFAFDRADFLVDINGYFAPDNGTGLLFFPVTQCRAADSRSAAGPFGGPIYSFPFAPSTRTVPLPASSCVGIPSNAKAYALNVTAIPGGTPMPYLTAWPNGGLQPNASILNAFQGQTVTNSLILPAGTIGAVDVFAAARTHVVLDVGGYFAPGATQAGSIINMRDVDGTHYCLDVPNGDYRSEVTLITWPCHGGDNQQFTRSNTGEIKIGGLCVDAYFGGSNGASVGLWGCHGGQNQKWTLMGDGRILGEGGFCLTPRNAMPGYATDVILTNCEAGALGQKWVGPKE